MALPGRSISVDAGFLYPNGMLPNYVNPIGLAARRPTGHEFSGYSGRDTYVNPNPKAPAGEDMATEFYDLDADGMPVFRDMRDFYPRVAQPALNPTGPSPAPLVSPSNVASAEPANTPAKAAARGEGAGFISQIGDLGSRSWAYSPWATLFFGFAVLWLGNEMFLKDPYIDRTTRTLGRSEAAPARAATGAGKGVVGSLTDAAGAVTDAAENAIESVVPR